MEFFIPSIAVRIPTKAAIPTAIASSSSTCNVSEIMEWGNWESNSFKVYTKNEREKKRVIFGKIVECLKINKCDE